MGINSSKSSGYPHPTAFRPPTQRRRGRYREDELGYYQAGYGYPGTFPQAQALPQTLTFQPQNYQYMQTPAPPTGFPQPMQSIHRPVIPIVPSPGAQNVVPNVIPGTQRTHRRHASAPMTMPQPVIPPPVIPQGAVPQYSAAPVIPQMPQMSMPQAPQMTQMPQPTQAAAIPDPVSFPEPRIATPNPQSQPRRRVPLAPGQYGPYDQPAQDDPRNPLPTPPKDIFEFSPYMRMLDDLRRPIDESTLTRSFTIPASSATAPPTAVSASMGMGVLYPTTTTVTPDGSRSTAERRHRRKNSIFHVFGRRSPLQEEEDEPPPAVFPTESIPATTTPVVPMMQQMLDVGTSYVYAPPLQMAQVASLDGNTMPIPTGTPVPMMPAAPARGPSPNPGRGSTPVPRQSVLIHENSELAGLIHWSPHPVHYEHKSYPTAWHLLEAMKFMRNRPDIAERIQMSRTLEEAQEISYMEQANVRPDWENVVRSKMDEVLYNKLLQHPDLRKLLLDTGIADLIFQDRRDEFWGSGILGHGLNELGRSLMRVRERLREERVGAGT